LTVRIRSRERERGQRKSSANPAGNAEVLENPQSAPVPRFGKKRALTPSFLRRKRPRASLSPTV
jgi:hypothetical protein